MRKLNDALLHFYAVVVTRLGGAVEAGNILSFNFDTVFSKNLLEGSKEGIIVFFGGERNVFDPDSIAPPILFKGIVF